MTAKPKRPLYGAAAMGAGPGRPKGSVNKISTEFRDTVKRLLQDNAENVGTWLAMVAKDDPGKALDLIAKLAEYSAPKLNRIEHVGEGGGPVRVVASRYDRAL